MPKIKLIKKNYNEYNNKRIYKTESTDTANKHSENHSWIVNDENLTRLTFADRAVCDECSICCDGGSMIFGFGYQLAKKDIKTQMNRIIGARDNDFNEMG